MSHMESIKAFKTQMKAKSNLMVENLKVRELRNLLPEIKKGTVYNIITQKNISPYAFLLDAIEKHNAIDDLTVVTYRVSEKAANNFKYMVEAGLVKKFTLLVNDNYEVLMKDKASILLDLDNENDNFKLIQKNSHAKITLINAGNEYYVISGSGNYSNNPKIEQYTVLKDKELYDFHKGWIENGQ